MGKTFSTGLLTNGIWQDASNNIGIGGSPSGSYKLEVTGTSRVSGNLQLGSTTASSTTTPITLNMGGTYGTTLLNGIKIKMFDDGTTVHGLGVIAGNLYLNATDAATKITLNTNNTERLAISSTGAATFSGVVGANIAPLANYGLTTKGLYGIWIQRNSVNDSGIEIYHDGTNSIINTSYQSTGSYGGMLIYTGGYERMRITSGGIVTIPYQPSFYATSTAGSTSYANNEVIVFNTARHNTGSYYNTSNGRFTAPVAGKYLFTLNVYAYSGNNTGIVLTVNGSQYSITDVTPYVNVASNAVAITDGFTLVWELAAGDYVEPRSRGTSLIYRAHSHFSGQLLS